MSFAKIWVCSRVTQCFDSCMRSCWFSQVHTTACVLCQPPMCERQPHALHAEAPDVLLEDTGSRWHSQVLQDWVAVSRYNLGVEGCSAPQLGRQLGTTQGFVSWHRGVLFKLSTEVAECTYWHGVGRYLGGHEQTGSELGPCVALSIWSFINP